MCNKGDFCVKNKDGVRKSDFIIDFASSLVLELKVNVAVFCFVLFVRMAGKCRTGKLKLFTGYCFRVYWRATVSLVVSCSWLQVGKMFRNKCKTRVLTARM